MAKSDFKTVDEYMANLPEVTRDALELVRRAIREGMPDAEEAISYQIPAFKLEGRRFYFAGYKRHYSIYCDEMGALIDAFAQDLAGCEVSKGTIKFRLAAPVPSDLITRLARHQAKRYREDDNQRRG